MHSAIVVVEMPEQHHSHASNQGWQVFLASANGLQQGKPNHLKEQPGVSELGENVWLVNFHQNPAALARLVESATRHGLKYGILQLDAAPQWHPTGFAPKGTEVRNG